MSSVFSLANIGDNCEKILAIGAVLQTIYQVYLHRYAILAEVRRLNHVFQTAIHAVTRSINKLINKIFRIITISQRILQVAILVILSPIYLLIIVLEYIAKLPGNCRRGIIAKLGREKEESEVEITLEEYDKHPRYSVANITRRHQGK